MLLRWNVLSPEAGNLFRARARRDLDPEQLVGRSDKRKPQNEDVIRCIYYNTFIAKQADQ